MASSAEKERAWMSATNDDAEGQLGSYRIYVRNKPCTSLHQYNAQAMFHKNNTQDFIDAHMSSQRCSKFLKNEARTTDSSGVEAKRREELARANAEVAETRRKKDADRLAKKAAEEERLSRITLILEPEDLKKLKDDDLKSQLAKFRQLDTLIPKVSTLKTKNDRLQAVLEAVERCKRGETEAESSNNNSTLDNDEEDLELHSSETDVQ